MKYIRPSLTLPLLTILVLCAAVRPQAGAHIASSDLILVGSTPAGPTIRSALSIDRNESVDFIRWHLVLRIGQNDSRTFLLNINFGVGQPNTPGFIGGGQKRTFEGRYTVARDPGGRSGEVVHLSLPIKSSSGISMLKVSENLFHLLTPDDKLMVGNGGWSYSLNRDKPFEELSSILFSLSDPSAVLNDTARQIVYVGRTPCVDFARHYGIRVDSDCNKIKWKLTLCRDPKTFVPTIYNLKSTLNRSADIEGRWNIMSRTDSKRNVVVCQLEQGFSGTSILFLVGDENIMFLLDKNERLLSGDDNFGFTLNRENK